jgi:hypothetical protein
MELAKRNKKQENTNKKAQTKITTTTKKKKRRGKWGRGRNEAAYFPKTTCFPSKWGVALKVIKNWHPLEFGPELARDKSPRSE